MFENGSPGFCSALPKQSSEFASRIPLAPTCATGSAGPNVAFTLSMLALKWTRSGFKTAEVCARTDSAHKTAVNTIRKRIQHSFFLETQNALYSAGLQGRDEEWRRSVASRVARVRTEGSGQSWHENGCSSGHRARRPAVAYWSAPPRRFVSIEMGISGWQGQRRRETRRRPCARTPRRIKSHADQEPRRGDCAPSICAHYGRVGDSLFRGEDCRNRSPATDLRTGRLGLTKRAGAV